MHIHIHTFTRTHTSHYARKHARTQAHILILNEMNVIALAVLKFDFPYHFLFLCYSITAGFGVPTYLFRFDYTYDSPAPFLGAYHGNDFYDLSKL